MVGMTGTPGQNSAVSFSIAPMISWCSGEGVLSTGPPNGVIEMPSSASTRFRVAYTSPIGSPGRTRQLTVALALCGSALTACPPWICVATQVVRSCAL